MVITRMLRHSLFGFLACSAVLATWSTTHAEEYASDQRAEAARGHYARARALLIEALAEFDRGRRSARPDVLRDH
ncbi:MAG: hypothetical protein KDD44_12155, partial [Bdellovibrionales bacterium]|nr:hypothetical protein [Bdellovibrionales bacterium]